MARFLTTLLLCGLPACAWATSPSPYDVLTLPSRPLGGIAIAECGQYLGGLRTGSSCQYALDGRATLDRRVIPELGGWSLIADLEALGGGRPSADFVGDAQGVSNIEAPWALRPYELVLGWRPHSDRTHLRAGLIEVSDEFLFVPGTSELINSSFGLSPTVSLNLATSTFPKPGWGFTADHRFGKRWHGRLGVFQGDPNARERPFSDGAFVIGEADYSAKDGATLSFGGWRLRRPGRSRPGFASRAWGAEFASTVLIDQDLRAFTQAAVAQGTDLAAPYYVEAGLRLQGPTWLRPQDELTVAAARAWLRAAPGLSLQPESVLELLYSLAVLPNVYLQPDLQWVHHPLLVGRARGDALASFLRLYVNFE